MRKGRTLPWFAVVLLAACHGDSSQAPQPKATPPAHAPAAVKLGPTPEELTAGMVEAVTLANSAVPVAVKFDLASRPTVGQPLEIVIAVMPQVAAGSATVQVSGGDGLQLASTVGPIDIPSIEPAQVYRVNLTMTPTTDGVHLLGLNVSLKRDDITETRSFSVPVIVASSGDAIADAKRAP
ncbi:MAG: hypothetical protein QOG17_678 [Gammaproteobacteria bacterium]|nr:hypothetical protein [Gammaproteobacteria bacterium]